MKKLKLSILPDKYGVCHFAKNDPVPDWVKDANFSSITRTSDELSIICPQEIIPGGVLVQENWRVFKVEGPFGFEVSGIVSAVSRPLAEAEISILNVSTYQTDYLLVQEKDFEKAKEVLADFHCFE